MYDSCPNDSMVADQDDAASVDMFFEGAHSHITDVEEVWFSGGHGGEQAQIRHCSRSEAVAQMLEVVTPRTPI